MYLDTDLSKFYTKKLKDRAAMIPQQEIRSNVIDTNSVTFLIAAINNICSKLNLMKVKDY